MSKIFEALENAEKQRVRKGSFPFQKPDPAPAPAAKEEKKAAPVMAPKEEKKVSPVPEPKSERVERQRPVPPPREPIIEKKTEAKAEKSAASIPEPKEVRTERPAPSFAPEQTAPAVAPRSVPVASAPALTPREEKKTSPAPETKSGWVEKSGLFHSPKTEEVKGAMKEEPKTAPLLAPKGEKKIPAVVAPKFTPPAVPKEERQIAPVPQPREGKADRHQEVPPPKAVVKPARPERRGFDSPLVSISQPGSLGAEQFRKLRTHILKLSASNGPKTIMVTSATAGEGKTFVAANLAAGIAHDLHYHALLVDCDLRSPALSHWFGVQNGHGLSDYLVGRGQLSELILKTEMEKLNILTGGSSQEKPVELIGSKRMEALIRELKLRYDDRYIILDSTPLLATSEPEVLARLVDGILMVVRAGVTPRETVKQAVASLDPEKIMGFVLNDVQFKSSGLSSRYFGSDGYYARYGYGYGTREAEPRSPLKGISSSKKKWG